MVNFVLSKTPLGALHWRVRFRRTVTYRPSIWILSRLPTCRSELGQPWRPPFPANPPPILYPPPTAALRPNEFYAWQFCSFRGIVSRKIQSAKFLRLSYTRLSETNGLPAAHLVSIKRTSPCANQHTRYFEIETNARSITELLFCFRDIRSTQRWLMLMHDN